MYWQWIKEPVVLALIGATPGALRGLNASKRHGWLRSLSDVLVGLICAASAGDWLTPAEKPMAALLIGLVAGMLGARLLDALYALAPELARELGLGVVRRMTGQAPGYDPYRDEVEVKDE